MRLRRSGPIVADRLVTVASGFFDRRLSRRGFISKATVTGTAIAATGCAVVAQPGSPYTFVTDCPGGTACRDGYTEFCCVINSGNNTCPPGTFAAGWWRADYSVFCNGTRYYIDCNDFSGGAQPCHCADGCDHRKVYCNNFRYGSCNDGIPGTGVIACRMVTCTPPYFIPGLGCSPSGAVDNSTAGHFVDCAPYTPASAPPPPAPNVAVLPPVGVVGTADGNTATIVARASDKALWASTFDGTTWLPWASLGGNVTSTPAIASPAPGELMAFFKSTNRALFTKRNDVNGWGPQDALNGILTADPVAVSPSPGVVEVFARGVNNAVFFRRWQGAWGAWTSLGGTALSNLAVTSGAGRPAVFARGTDKGLWYRRREGSGYAPWRSLGGEVTADPAVTAEGDDLYVFSRGTDNALWYRVATSAGWQDWRSLGANLGSDPVAVSDPSGVYVFVRLAGALWARRRTSGVWSDWLALGGDVTARPMAISTASGLHVMIRDGNGRIATRRLVAGAWSSWTDLGLPSAPLGGWQ